MAPKGFLKFQMLRGLNKYKLQNLCTVRTRKLWNKDKFFYVSTTHKARSFIHNLKIDRNDIVYSMKNAVSPVHWPRYLKP